MTKLLVPGLLVTLPLSGFCKQGEVEVAAAAAEHQWATKAVDWGQPRQDGQALEAAIGCQWCHVAPRPSRRWTSARTSDIACPALSPIVIPT